MSDSAERAAKLALAQDIGRLEGELSRHEAQLREFERKGSAGSSQRTAAGVALLLGILGILFLSFLWPLWAFLVVIGLLSALTAGSKSRSAAHDREYTEQQIAHLRSKLAESRARLAII